MKKTILLLTAGVCTQIVHAQTISTFEEKTLAANSYFNGNDFSGAFTSGNAEYYNRYDTTFGAAYGYWAEGWAVSNTYDTVTQASDYVTQLYSAKEIAPSSNLNFGIGTQGSRIVLTASAAGKVANGFHITNSTYAYNSMALGDMIAKKFGGISGNDPDYFKLVIKKYFGGTLGTDSVEFYLADFRFSDNSMDYIVSSWTWVDLTSLGNCDSLEFTLRSTDAGSFGINTPLYYCIDNFTTANSPVGIASANNTPTISIYPNPCINTLTVSNAVPGAVTRIVDYSGKTVYSTSQHTFDVEFLPAGIYYLVHHNATFTFVKQ